MLNKITQLFQLKPKNNVDYSFLVYKLAKLHGVSEYEVFQKSGQKYTRHMIDNAFKSYMNDGSIPWWVRQHLKENMEWINKYSLPYSVRCIHR
jgi:hypothetical protein